MSLLLPILAIAAGIALLVWSADRFVDGAASVARYFHISPLLIGMVIIGFGTSLPEMLVSALSAFNDKPGLALGNAYGSNICNIALILGVSGLICPLQIQPNSWKRDLPLLAVATLFCGLLIYDNFWGCEPLISRWDALGMLLIFAGIMLYSAGHGKDENPPAPDSAALEAPETVNIRRAFFWVFAGLALLMGSSYLLVWGAVAVATALGVSELVIGLTIVAVGTSLPEFASSVAAARRKEHDLAIGNILGSNLFNTLVVVGIAGVIRPFPVLPEVLHRDYPLMFGLIGVLYLCGRSWRGRPGRISRIDGAIMLLFYVGYTILLLYTAKPAQG